MTYETILVENVDGVSIITLNRPERLNAWTYQMGAELSQAVQAGTPTLQAQELLCQLRIFH